MKTSAIIRIIIFSVLFFVLLGILLGGLCLTNFIYTEPSGENTVLERKVDAEEFSSLEIDWAAGSVTIGRTPDHDNIIIREVKDSNNSYTMSTEFDDSTLMISYGASKLNLGNLTSKDLVILVPSYWDCTQLEINGAALNIDINGVDIHTLEINGASNQLTFNGELNDLSVEGAANTMDVNITKGLSRVNIEGMGCKLDLLLPSNLGFDTNLSGLGISFQSSLKYSKEGNRYFYGNKACKIDVSGLGCQLSVDPS